MFNEYICTEVLLTEKKTLTSNPHTGPDALKNFQPPFLLIWKIKSVIKYSFKFAFYWKTVGVILYDHLNQWFLNV